MSNDYERLIRFSDFSQILKNLSRDFLNEQKSGLLANSLAWQNYSELKCFKHPKLQKMLLKNERISQLTCQKLKKRLLRNYRKQQKPGIKRRNPSKRNFQTDGI
jgi:hypothetical protein